MISSTKSNIESSIENIELYSNHRLFINDKILDKNSSIVNNELRIFNANKKWQLHSTDSLCEVLDGDENIAVRKVIIIRSRRDLFL